MMSGIRKVRPTTTTLLPTPPVYEQKALLFSNGSVWTECCLLQKGVMRNAVHKCHVHVSMSCMELLFVVHVILVSCDSGGGGGGCQTKLSKQNGLLQELC